MLNRANRLFVPWRIYKNTLPAANLTNLDANTLLRFPALVDENNFRLYIAKTYYLIGLSMLSVNSITTRDYWIAARFMSPEIGFFHHELASLELYILKDRVTALAIINECMKTARAALHCQQLLTDLKTPSARLCRR